MLGASGLGFRSPGEEFSKLGSGVRGLGFSSSVGVMCLSVVSTSCWVAIQRAM